MEFWRALGSLTANDFLNFEEFLSPTFKSDCILHEEPLEGQLKSDLRMHIFGDKIIVKRNNLEFNFYFKNVEMKDRIIRACPHFEDQWPKIGIEAQQIK